MGIRFFAAVSKPLGIKNPKCRKRIIISAIIQQLVSIFPLPAKLPMLNKFVFIKWERKDVRWHSVHVWFVALLHLSVQFRQFICTFKITEQNQELEVIIYNYVQDLRNLRINIFHPNKPKTHVVLINSIERYLKIQSKSRVQTNIPNMKNESL